MAQEILEKIDILSRQEVRDEVPLDDNETKLAAASLIKKPWRSVTRQTVDPPIMAQTFGLFSFVASGEQTRTKYNVFGTVKLRGNYATIEDAEAAAEEIVRRVDSNNHIFICRVGQSVPLTNQIKYTDNLKNVDLNEVVEQTERDNQRARQQQERKNKEEVKSREEEMRVQSTDAPDDIDPLQAYCLLQGKRAYLEMRLEQEAKNIEDKIKPPLAKVKAEVAAADLEHPEFKDLYKEQILSARRAVGIKDSHEWKGQGEFLNYL